MKHRSKVEGFCRSMALTSTVAYLLPTKSFFYCKPEVCVCVNGKKPKPFIPCGCWSQARVLFYSCFFDFFSVNLLLIWNHQAEIIVVKHLIQGCNNMMRWELNLDHMIVITWKNSALKLQSHVQWNRCNQCKKNNHYCYCNNVIEAFQCSMTHSM